MKEGQDLREEVRRRYGRIASEAAGASLGCGNPVGIADLAEGETVLDLGCGGGMDVFSAARKVSPTGFVYGLDMTDEMLELAERNRQQAGLDNVEFIKGHIESIPLPDASVDVVISNCVINLSVDKGSTMREIYRVLRPGGRVAISDVVFTAPRESIPSEILESADLWANCISGAMTVPEYRNLLESAGLVDVDIELANSGADEGVDPGVACGAPAGACCGPSAGSRTDVRSASSPSCSCCCEDNRSAGNADLSQIPLSSANIRARKPECSGEQPRTDRIVSLGRALSDPIRVKMLAMMAAGRSCCKLPDVGAPASEGCQNDGICVCEFTLYCGLSQSRISYHLSKLKEAGLIVEEKRGKWSFYSIDRQAFRQALKEVLAQIGDDSSAVV